MAKDLTIVEVEQELGIAEPELELMEDLSSPEDELEEEVEQEVDEGYIDGYHRKYSLEEAEYLGSLTL